MRFHYLFKDAHKVFMLKIAIIFITISLNMCWDGSSEYPQHTFGLRNEYNNLNTFLSGGLLIAFT